MGLLRPPARSFLVICVALFATVHTVDSTCDLQICLNLRTHAREVLNVRDYIPGSEVAHMTAREHRSLCIAQRSFAVCLRQLREQRTGCQGNLNFHSAQNVIERHMRRFNCSHKGELFEPEVGPSMHHGPAYATVCTYQGVKKHRHCGLFGDPHLRTFSNQFQTCRVRGAWPLIDNEFLTVQVTNEAVSDGAATATTKLTVMIKRHDECASRHYLAYQAQTDYLPSTFEDGTSSAGPHKSVIIMEKSPQKHVELYLRYIDTTLVIRQVGRFFTLAIRMPADLVRKSVKQNPDGIQLCARGCPRSEIIDYQRFLSTRHERLQELAAQRRVLLAMERSVAEQRCRQAKLTDFYLDSCVFDLMTTGDTNFTMAAYHSLQDVLRLYPDAARSHRNRTSLRVDGVAVSRGATPHAFTNFSNLHYIHRMTYVLLLAVVSSKVLLL